MSNDHTPGFDRWSRGDECWFPVDHKIISNRDSEKEKEEEEENVK
jgi:hypothetical protein